MGTPPCTAITLVDDGPFQLVIGVPFSQLLVPVPATAPVGTYTFGVSPDICLGCGINPPSLPPGITLGATTGLLSGTPTGTGSCAFVGITISYGVPGGPVCTSVVCIELVVSTKPLPICYMLLVCGGRPIPIIVTNDLSLYVGQVIQILGECFTVALSQTCVGAITLNNPVITVFQDCCSCSPPHCYELVDCTLNSPAIVTDTDLSQYVGKTVKVCNYVLNNMIIPIDGIPIICTVPNELGFITQITGTTSGFYYESSSNSIKPYANLAAQPLLLGDQICVNPIVPFQITSFSTGTYLLQFFIGTTPITTQITINPGMPLSTVQYFISNAIIFSNTSITVNLFDNFNHLDVTIIVNGAIDTTTVNAIVTYPGITYPPTVTVTGELLGGCICYTVNDLGFNCNCLNTPFLGVIDSFYDDCICCDPPPEPEPPPYEPTIPEIDKHTYFIRESECDILANQTFANAMYDIFKTDQYGIESCCPRNFNQIWIQKELSDLSKINC